MAHVEVSQLSKQEHDELAVAYAALLLHDDNLEITVGSPILDFIFFLLGRETFQDLEGFRK
jgi:hypothetical protein